MSRSILLVCTGNTCRSPLAEAMTRRLAAERGLDVIVSSAGTSAWEGAPASDGSILVGLERNLDLSSHRARVLTRELVTDATIVLGMSEHHAAQALALGGEGKVYVLADYAAGSDTGHSIHDPFGAGLDAYRRMADEIDAEIPRVLERLAREPISPESA